MEKYKRWADVPDHLKSKTTCTEKRLIIKDVLPVAEVYQNASKTWISLYDIRTLTKKPELTKVQLEATIRAQETREARYTCKKCGLYSTKHVNKENQLCKECYSWFSREIRELELSNKAIQDRLKWSTNKDNYVILDTETTGLYAEDEVVDIAIVDLQGNTLFTSLIRPTKHIPDEAIEIHGITDEMVTNAPSMANIVDTLDSLLQGKIILAYNANFDSSMIHQSLAIYGINRDYEWTCVMENEMEIMQSERFISLARACGIEKCSQSHRALNDCNLVYHLVTNTEQLNKRLLSNLQTIDEYKKDL